MRAVTREPLGLNRFVVDLDSHAHAHAHSSDGGQGQGQPEQVEVEVRLRGAKETSTTQPCRGPSCDPYEYDMVMDHKGRDMGALRATLKRIDAIYPLPSYRKIHGSQFLKNLLTGKIEGGTSHKEYADS